MVDVGGVTACHGFRSSFRTTQYGLSLMDVSSTMILTPGPVLDFLLTNQNLKDPRCIDWGKAKKMLKNMRAKARHNNVEFKRIGSSEKACNQQYFPWKMRSGDGSTEEIVGITVYEYFAKNRKIALDNSAYMPCLDVGKPKRPNYLSLELRYIVSLQQYTKVLSSMQIAFLVEKQRQKAEKRIQLVTDAVKNYCYDDDPMLKAYGISIQKQLAAFERHDKCTNVGSAMVKTAFLIKGNGTLIGRQLLVV
ncbi:hypothetical protein AQUCO_05300125v1 [Aquilegia coerulea]|uniref:PAZ domain-containing protein n=1 Tax=Aquilegia coerulea TaxID=218851 RepID=A0A2G5CIG0_AQUCA|nr:hypothetical protein AQUCO_05300125v1 [Aquilegia coerulea]